MDRVCLLEVDVEVWIPAAAYHKGGAASMKCGEFDKDKGHILPVQDREDAAQKGDDKEWMECCAVSNWSRWFCEG
jgi:hypothetical protein